MDNDMNTIKKLSKCPHGHCTSCMICFRDLRGQKLHSCECNFECGLEQKCEGCEENK